MSTTCRTAAASVLLAFALPALASPAVAASQGDQRRPAAVQERDQRAEPDRAKPDRKKPTPAPGETIRATVVKTGWWWLVNEPPPESGVLAAPTAPAPTTPKGSIPVGAAAGDAERISAIEVRLKAAPGSTVTSFEMVLRESSEPTANANAEQAVVVACPVTEAFWADGSAAAWRDRPAYDCSLAEAEGKRDAKGVWRFDLTPFAATWLTEGNVDSRSVVLVEKVEAPEGFQVAFDGPKAEGVGLELRADAPTPPPTGSGDTSVDGTGGAGGTGSVGGFSGSGTSSGSSSGIGSSSGPGSASGALTDASAAAEQEGPAAETPAAPPGQLAATPVAAVAPWYSGISKGAYALLPLALGLAYLIMVALGPDARPVPVTGRRGVGRALERLRETRRSRGATR